MQLVVLVFLCLMLVCVVKLVQLQILQHTKFAMAALSSLTSEELAAAPRGSIVDNAGNVLVEDVPSFDVAVRTRQLQLTELTVDSVRKIRDIRSVQPAGYAALLAGGWEAFGRPEYGDAVRLAFLKLRQEAGGGAPPSGETLSALRALHFRAEREAAIARLAAAEPLVAELAAEINGDRRKLAEGLYQAMEHSARNFAGDPPPVYTDVSRPAWERLYLRQNCPAISARAPLPGILTSVSVRRNYPQGRTACHVLGYLQPLREEDYLRLAAVPEGLTMPDRTGAGDISATRRWFFKTNDGERTWMRPRGRQTYGRSLTDERVGACGVEAFYNQQLRGQHAYRTWIMRLQSGGIRGGEAERTALRHSEARRGAEIRLTLELPVQRAAQEALAGSGCRGAVVFLDPKDGAVLAMASLPDFEPALFVSGTGEQRLAVMTDPTHPLICRAYQGLYPLGSVFKAVLGTGAIESRAISPTADEFNCTHVYRVGNATFECLGTHGLLPFPIAMQKSCNIFFYHTGKALERWGQRPGAGERERRLGGLGYWGECFGLGQVSGLDLPGEKGGLMPNREWKRNSARTRWDRNWTEGDTCNTSIGQGAMLVTPLQAAVVMAAIANGGTLVRPRVLHSVDPGGEADDAPRGRLPLAENSRTLRHVRESLVRVVNEPGGTGRLAQLPHVTIAGKTGSAENPHGRTHAWFCGFAPADDPTVAFAVVLETGGHGGAEAAPVARKVLETLFRDIRESGE
jgi:cell division protein FtsI/penicillin-binding protein 2